MKRILIFILCALAAVACSRDKFSLSKPSIFTNPGDVYMSVDDVLMEDDTKTEASLDEATGLSFNWVEGDKVGVYSGEGGLALFNIRSGEGTSSAFFKGDGFELKEGNTYYALYPYDGTATTSTAIPLDYSSRKVDGQDNLSDLIPFDYLGAAAPADQDHHAVFKFAHLSSFARVKMSLPASAAITSIDLIPTYDPLPDALSYNIKTGATSVTSEKVVKNIPFQNVSGDKVTFWLPFVSRELSDAAMVVNTSSGPKYSVRLGAKKMVSGKSYRWDVEASSLSATPAGTASISSFGKTTISSMPSGQYSGITRIDGDKYAVVHDKYKGGGIIFFNLKISNSGTVSSSSFEIPAGTSGSTVSRDPEDIVYVPSRNSLFVSGEADQQILEYDMNGQPTGAKLNVPADMGKGKITGNYGFESLGYNAVTGLFWTTTESTLPKDKDYQINSCNIVRLQSFRDSDLNPDKRYLYLMDQPEKGPGTNITYAFGVPGILALDDGTLIIMEREAYVPMSSYQEMLNAMTKIKFYQVDPVNDKGGILAKKLLHTITTDIWAWANYEGLCLGPQINGSKTILLVNDSQDRYGKSIGGIIEVHLNDYLLTLKLSN